MLQMQFKKRNGCLPFFSSYQCPCFMASFSTWGCRRSEEFRYGHSYSAQRVGSLVFHLCRSRNKAVVWEEPPRKQSVTILCVRKSLVEAREVCRAGRTRPVDPSRSHGSGQVSVWLGENAGVEVKGKIVPTTAGNPCWGTQWAEKC